MSRNGELARIGCKTQKQDVIIETYEVQYGESIVGPHGEKIRIVEFEELQKNQEFIYTGDFLCWKLFYNQKAFSVIHIGDVPGKFTLHSLFKLLTVFNLFQRKCRRRNQKLRIQTMF